ncbi:hypothetical protein LJC67_06295, partial [Bacteroidales bacterium OttesenSCG-928-A14]|nr:hypothetical protein [Bacteroidales bacterium OttesenSCG-928-A14]
TVTEVVSDAKKTVDFETLKSDVKSCENEDKTINLAVIFVYIILIAAIAVTVFFALLQLFQNFSSSYKALLAVLALVVVFVISYFASSGELSASAIKEGLTGNQVKIIGAGVITCYFVFFGAIASIFISWLINKLKKS